MSKKVLALILAMIIVFITGCGANENPSDKNDKENANIETEEDTGNNDESEIEERNADGSYFYKGKITSLSSDRHIEMEIIDSQVAFGIYWVLVSSQTKFVDNNGKEISRNDLKVGDIIEVAFSGQVMMSRLRH